MTDDINTQGSEYTAKIRKRLRMLRESAGLSLEEMGSKMNYSKSQISKIETSKTKIDTEILYGYSKALNLPVSEIINVDDDFTGFLGDYLVKMPPHYRRLAIDVMTAIWDNCVAQQEASYLKKLYDRYGYPSYLFNDETRRWEIMDQPGMPTGSAAKFEAFNMELSSVEELAQYRRWLNEQRGRTNFMDPDDAARSDEDNTANKSQS